ncbi:MAG: SDR family oxidoreductase [Thermodesulfovibrionales bacterium]
MKIIIFGSTGMLGQALLKETQNRNYSAIGIARKNADICADIMNDSVLRKILSTTKPDVVINTVAVVNLDECENNAAYAYLVNARPASILSDMCNRIDAYYVHISTDHYFTGDKDKKHDETYPVKIVNEYARTKYAGEFFALLNPQALVVRTNIVGFRNLKDHPTFLEWVIESLKKDIPITLFEDYFTSSINVTQVSTHLFDLINKRACGVVNLASREVKSKKDFIEAIAHRLNIHLSRIEIGSVFNLHGVPRAESLGLDVTKAENILGYRLPTFEQVISSIIKDYSNLEGYNAI